MVNKLMGEKKHNFITKVISIQISKEYHFTYQVGKA